jgi:hypothetical protein
MTNTALAYFNPIGAIVSGFQAGDKQAWEDQKSQQSQDQGAALIRKMNADYEQQQLDSPIARARQQLALANDEAMNPLRADSLRTANLMAGLTADRYGNGTPLALAQNEAALSALNTKKAASSYGFDPAASIRANEANQAFQQMNHPDPAVQAIGHANRQRAMAEDFIRAKNIGSVEAMIRATRAYDPTLELADNANGTFNIGGQTVDRTTAANILIRGFGPHFESQMKHADFQYKVGMDFQAKQGAFAEGLTVEQTQQIERNKLLSDAYNKALSANGGDSVKAMESTRLLMGELGKTSGKPSISSGLPATNARPSAAQQATTESASATLRGMDNSSGSLVPPSLRVPPPQLPPAIMYPSMRRARDPEIQRAMDFLQGKGIPGNARNINNAVQLLRDDEAE